MIRETGADVHNLTPAAASATISRAKNELQDAEGFARSIDSSDPVARTLADIFGRYQAELRRNNAFDFDDLISETVFLFRNHPDIAATYRRKCRHILVDEYQDTNHAQYALIRELTRKEIDPQPDAPATPGAHITVVGDSDQSIYSFRGADIRNITEFERDFEGATTILLEQRYRSTQNILSAANAVIGIH